MTERDKGISAGANLGDGLVTFGANYELSCCSQPGMAAALWVSAAELVYELTGEPGRVVRNKISFEIDGTTIDLNLLNGAFTIDQGTGQPIVGRKGIDLLMKWQGYDLDKAIEFIANKYSIHHAMAMAKDFAAMKVQMLAERMNISLDSDESVS